MKEDIFLNDFLIDYLDVGVKTLESWWNELIPDKLLFEGTVHNYIHTFTPTTWYNLLKRNNTIKAPQWSYATQQCSILSYG